MFLLYINENISSIVRLFADDCVMYRIIDSLEDSLCLQKDLSTILNWTKKWQMQLNIDKCVVLRCTRSTSPINYDYNLNDETLQVTEHIDTWDLFFVKACNGRIIFKLCALKQTDP